MILNKEENKQNGNVSSSNSYTEKLQVPQKKSKAERKQRLFVRSDDSSDILFKFDDYNRKETNYKDEDMSEEEECEQDNGRSSTNPSPTPSNANTGNFRSARRKVHIIIFYFLKN